MSIDGNLSPDALVRKMQMDQVFGPNAGPTQGQVTRDPHAMVLRAQPAEAARRPRRSRSPNAIEAQLQRLQDNLRG
jgi:hypothetical protein